MFISNLKFKKIMNHIHLFIHHIDFPNKNQFIAYQKNSCLIANKMSKKDSVYSNNESLRAAFKQSLTKLSQISTRDLAYKQIKTLIIQNKTTSNLRIWLSVLSENRQKHNQSQINVVGFIVEKYAKGLLDPLDKIPSLQKTVFRITQLLLKCFADSQTNVQLACQKAWVQIYLSCLIDEESELKKKVLYNNLEALINGGGGKISQTTAQLVIDGLLESSLNKEDHQFFKQIAKRTLVLFLKTTVVHYSSLSCLQTIISFFGINNLIPLCENIVNKIILYLGLAPPNSSGYKIKSQCCNAFSLIGQQIDKNGLVLYSKIIKILQDLATDKVWAVQATGRKALSTWKNKKQEWEQQFFSKQQKYDSRQEDAQSYQQKLRHSPSKNYNDKSNHYIEKVAKNNGLNSNNKNFNSKINRQIPLVISKDTNNQNFHEERQQIGRNIQPNQQSKKYQTYNQGFYRPAFNGDKYLHKNTGVGGGNNVQTVQNFYQKQKGQQTYSKKMQEIKKSIYRESATQIQYDQTIPWQQAKSLPVFPKKINQQGQQNQNQDVSCLQDWEEIVKLSQKGFKQQAVKKLIQMDDDIYFLRFMLQHGQGLLKDLTRQSSAKILKKMLSIQKSNFMEQMLFKLVGQTIKIRAGQILSNAQNLQITRNLQKCKNIEKFCRVSQKLKGLYEQSLLT